MTRYVKIINGGRRIEFAPDHYAGKLDIPSEEEHNAHGYYRYNEEKPNPPESHRVASTRFELRDNSVITLYSYETIPEAPPPVKTYDAFKCYCKLTMLGMMDEVKSWLIAEDLWDAFVIAKSCPADHPYFVAGLEKFKARFNLSDERVEEILADCEV